MSSRADAGTDQVSYSGTGFANTSGGVSFCAWVKIAVDTNINATIMRLSAAGTIITFATDSDGLAGPGVFTVGNSTVNPLGFGAVGNWRFVAFTADNDDAITYAKTSSGSTQTSNTTGIGGSNTPTLVSLFGRGGADTSENLNGSIAYARLWFGVRLTQSEFETEAVSANAVKTANLFADWQLLTASDLTDHSGNGRDLTAGSTSLATDSDNPPIGGSTQTIVVPLLDTDSSIFSPQVIQIIQAPVLSASSTIFSPSVVPGSVTVQVPLVSAPPTIFGPGVSSGLIIQPPIVSVPSSVFDPGVVSLLQLVTLALLTAPSSIFNPGIVGGEASDIVASIADTARVNMLANRALSEPRRETNSDLMALVLADGTQTLVTKTSASVGTHLLRYMMNLRN